MYKCNACDKIFKTPKTLSTHTSKCKIKPILNFVEDDKKDATDEDEYEDEYEDDIKFEYVDEEEDEQEDENEEDDENENENNYKKQNQPPRPKPTNIKEYIPQPPPQRSTKNDEMYKHKEKFDKYIEKLIEEKKQYEKENKYYQKSIKNLIEKIDAQKMIIKNKIYHNTEITKLREEKNKILDELNAQRDLHHKYKEEVKTKTAKKLYDQEMELDRKYITQSSKTTAKLNETIERLQDKIVAQTEDYDALRTRLETIHSEKEDILKRDMDDKENKIRELRMQLEQERYENKQMFLSFKTEKDILKNQFNNEKEKSLAEFANEKNSIINSLNVKYEILEKKMVDTVKSNDNIVSKIRNDYELRINSLQTEMGNVKKYYDNKIKENELAYSAEVEMAHKQVEVALSNKVREYEDKMSGQEMQYCKIIEAQQIDNTNTVKRLNSEIETLKKEVEHQQRFVTECVARKEDEMNNFYNKKLIFAETEYEKSKSNLGREKDGIINDKMREIQRLEETLKKTNDTISEYQFLHNKAKMEIDTLKKQYLIDTNNQKIEYDNMFKEKENKIFEISLQMKDVYNESNSKVKQIKEQYDILEANYRKEKEDNIIKTKELDTYRNKVEIIEQNMSNIGSNYNNEINIKLNEQYNKYYSEINSKQELLKSKEKLISELNEEMSQLKDELSKYRNELTSKINMNNSITDKLKECDMTINSVKLELSYKENDNKNLSTMVAELQKKCSQFDIISFKLKSTEDTLKHEKQVTEDKELKINKLYSELRESQNEISKLSEQCGKLDNFREKYNELKSQVSILENTDKQKSAEIVNLNSQISNHLNDISKLNAEILKHEVSTRELYTSIHEKDVSLREVSQSISEYQNKILILESDSHKMVELEKTLHEKEKIIKELNTKFTSTNLKNSNIVNSIHKELKELRGVLKLTEEQKHRFNDDNIKLSALVDELYVKINTYEKDISELTKKLEDNEKIITIFNTADSKDKQIKDCMEAWRKIKAENHILVQEINILKSKLLEKK